MKKHNKSKTAKKLKSKSSKRSSKRSRQGSELPDLVAVMMKVAERLEILEKKVDLVVGRQEALSSMIQRMPENFRHPGSAQTAPFQKISQESRPNEASKSRPLYRAVCAECRTACEVPFKPIGGRPVYCKTCFEQRKASPNPKANVVQIQVPERARQMTMKHGQAGQGGISVNTAELGAPDFSRCLTDTSAKETMSGPSASASSKRRASRAVKKSKKNRPKPKGKKKNKR